MAALADDPFPDGGRYSRVRLLGKGGMGAVYEAEDRVRGGRVALKVMLQTDAERLLRFKREFRLAADLHHRNLVRLFELSVEERCWFFTMELVDGYPLTGLLSDPNDVATRPVGLDVATTSLATGIDPAGASGDPPGPACDLGVFGAVMGQLLDALEHLHSRGIIHRDLKPSNVRVDLGGAVRLLDFGLANRLDRSEDITAEGMVAGTLGYIAPEQMLGEPATPASDLYSLGCLMFQLLTGRLPFEGARARGLRGDLEDAPPRVDRRVHGVPPALVEACFRLLARDPSARPTIAEVRSALGARAAPSVGSVALPDSSSLFVGRAAELSVLASYLDRAEASGFSFAVVSGPSGIGKSALVSRLAGEAAGRGHLVFRGRCYEREQLPFRTLDRAVDAMITTLATWPAGRLSPLAPAFLELQRPFPAMALLTRSSRPSDLDPQQSIGAPHVVRMHRRFGEMLACLAEEHPVALVLDDLQWADDESVDLLEAVLASGPGRLTLIGTCRDEALDDDRPARRLLAVAGTRGRRVPLAPLDPSEARDLLEGVAAAHIDAGTRETIAEQAGGNPFLLVELGHRVRLGAGAVPQGGAAVLDVLLSELSPRATRLLEISATAGSDISEVLLAETSGLGADDFGRALDELFARRLLKRLADEPIAPLAPRADREPPRAAAWQARRLDLYHDRIREAVYQRLPPERRRALHEEIARLLEANTAGRGRDVEALLRHWTLAGDVVRRRRFALQAAERAEKQLAIRTAARMLRIVADDPEPGEPARAAAERWERLGDLHVRCGELAAAAEAYERALGGWETEAPGDARTVAFLRLSGRLGEARMTTGRVAEGVAAFRSAAHLAGFSLDRSMAVWLSLLVVLSLRVALAGLLSRSRRSEGALAPTQLAFLEAAVRALFLVWPRMAIEAALRSELLAWRVRDLRVLVRARASRATVPVLLRRMSPRRVRSAWVALEEADALAQDAGDADGAWVVRANEGILWLATDMARGRAALESAIAGLDQRGLGESYEGLQARAYLLIALLLKGDLRDVLALAARDLVRPGENVFNRAMALGARVHALALLGRLEEAEESSRALELLLAPLPLCALHAFELSVRTLVWTARGRFAEALDGAVAFERRARPRGAWGGGLQQATTRTAMLEACLGLSRAGRLSTPQRARAEGWARSLVTNGVLGSACLGYRVLSLLAHHAGDARRARRALERALDTSVTNTGRWARYVCLEAARDVTGLSSSQEEEAAALQAAEQLGPPFYRVQLAREPLAPPAATTAGGAAPGAS